MNARFLILILVLVSSMACSMGMQTMPATVPPNLSPEPTLILPTHSPAKTTPSVSVEPSTTSEPAWEWPRSTPEEQGISSAALASMLETLEREGQNIHSLLVLRHGVLVLEAYKHPFNAQTRHGVYSVTKSITSTLVGISSEEGLLNVEAPIVSYFPEVILDDPMKANIQVKHLLAMNSGVEWYEPLHSGLSDHWGILESDDPAQYFFTPALISEPGTLFNYNSGGSHLLSMLVQKVSGQTAEEFAASRLFNPLDIRDVAWLKDFTGHSRGGTGLELLPLDMAKLGQLMLDGGQWQGKQILPASWSSTATQVHSTPSPEMGYGYQWWIKPRGDYYALGWGGQQIHVFPEQDMVVVLTAGMSGSAMLHEELLETALLPSILSRDSLPADETGQARLAAAVLSLATPGVQTFAPISPLAQELDGKQWLVTGRGDWSIFSLHYINEREAKLGLELNGDPMELLLGLDGMVRITDTEEFGPIALLGYWESPDTFVLQQQNLREADWRITHLKFMGDTVQLHSEWFIEPYQEDSEAVLFGE